MRPKNIKKASKASWPFNDEARGLAAAAGWLGVSKEVLKLAKENRCPAFLSDNRVRLTECRDWLKAHPEIAKQVEDMPDIKREKALKAKVDRQNAEAAFAKTLVTIGEVEDILLPLIGLGKLTVSRMLQIPDRVCSRHAEYLQKARENPEMELMMSQQIKLDLEKEIRNALKMLSESEVAKIIEEAKQK